MTLQQEQGTSSLQPGGDRFDRLPKNPRVGAHRISGRVRRFWRYFLVALIAIALLVTAGIIGVNSIGSGTGSNGASGSNGETAAPQPAQTQPELDPTATVVVLNGTTTPNLAAGVDEVITRNGWGQIMFSDNAVSSDVEISAVFYASEADEAAALGLAAELGGVSIYESQNYTEYGARLVVLLGADYAGPGAEEAAAITARADAEPVAVTEDTPLG